MCQNGQHYPIFPLLLLNLPRLKYCRVPSLSLMRCQAQLHDIYHPHEWPPVWPILVAFADRLIYFPPQSNKEFLLGLALFLLFFFFLFPLTNVVVLVRTLFSSCQQLSYSKNLRHQAKNKAFVR